MDPLSCAEHLLEMNSQKIAGLLFLAIAFFCILGCRPIEEVVVERTVVVERIVVVTATPAPQYSRSQVQSAVESWPAKSDTFGETRLWAAVFDFCLREIPLVVRGSGPLPEPTAFVAVADGHGKWIVSTSCQARTLGGGEPRYEFRWLFFEEDPKVIALDGFAGEINLIR